MRISIMLKTFLTMLISFSLLFLIGLFITYQRFSQLYVDQNIEAVKDAIVTSAPLIQGGLSLDETPLKDMSSETTFIRIEGYSITQNIGPETMTDSQIIEYVVDIYDSPDVITEGELLYSINQIDDVYQISYLYKFATNDYMLIIPKIQSLRNVDSVLLKLGTNASIYLVITIAILSVLLAWNIARPIRKINTYAKKVSTLDFSTTLKLKRRDEFKELVSSLNEMTFNIQKSYSELNEANNRLAKDIDFEKNQETKKKELIMTINHEIKTPVSVIKGMVEGMIDSVGRYKNKEKYLPEILTQLETIESITKDLTYSLKLEDIAKHDDFCDAMELNEHLQTLTEFAHQRQVKLHAQILSSPINITKDLYLILASNLIKNAITYTTGKVIHIESSISGDKYILKVINDGEIPAEDLNKVFEPYYRITQISGSASGTGLGLFIVKQICELYGCTYKLFNDNGTVVAKIEILIKSSEFVTNLS